MSESEQEQERDDNAIVDGIADALAEVLAARETARLTRWLVVMEIIDESGNYGLWTIGGPDTKPWDMLGMLSYAETVQKADIVKPEEDDE